MIFRGLKKLAGQCSTLRLNMEGLKRFKDGEIPEALLYDRPFKLTKMENGITVATEHMDSHKASVTIFIRCGSRNETQQSSGTAHFLEHLHFKGTERRTRERLELEVQNMGGNLNAYTSRQNTCYMMEVFNKDVTRAVDIMGDMITNSLYRSQDVENERSTIYRELLETQKSNPLETTLQISHRGAFRDHQMALPILGQINNMRTITREMIAHYHRSNYVGDNIIIVACGPINHEQLVKDVEKYIVVPKSNPSRITNSTKPKFYPGIYTVDSSLTDKVNVCVQFDAPSYFDKDFFGYLLLQRMVGDKPETQIEHIAMTQSPHYRFQNLVSSYEGIIKQKGFYTAYLDTGLSGNYFLCEPDKIADAVEATVNGYKMLASKITDDELQRAKRKVYVQILQHENQYDLTQSLANNFLYYNRRVCRSEVAYRVSCMGTKDVEDVVKRINTDNLQMTLWGNIKEARFKGKKLSSFGK